MRAFIAERDPFWPGQLAVLTAILLYFALPSKLTVGPNWLLPAVEGAVLFALFWARPALARGPTRIGMRTAQAALAVLAITTLASVGLFARYLAQGGHANGRRLLEGGGTLWLTLVVVFAIVFWEVDPNSPVAAAEGRRGRPEFMFPQMTDEAERFRPGFRPGFIDYLYLSLTNATAFSPTDTMPLTPLAKFLMGIQSLAAFVTIGLVIARAVNVLS